MLEKDIENLIAAYPKEFCPRGKLPEFKGDPSRIEQGCCPPFTNKTNRQSIDNPLGETCQSIFQRLPWYILEVGERLIPKNKEDWPDLKPIEPR